METNNKDVLTLQTWIEHFMVTKGVQDFDVKNALDPLDIKELEDYLAYKENDDLCTLSDAETEKKISTCILKYLHDSGHSSYEENILYCRQAIIALHDLKLQMWYAKGNINESKFKRLKHKQKLAEIFAEARYRAKVAPVGAALLAVVGLLVSIALGTEVLVAIAVFAAVGLVLSLCLPKKDIEKLKQWGKEQLLPKLKNAIEQSVDIITQKIPQMTQTALEKLKKDGFVKVGNKVKPDSKPNVMPNNPELIQNMQS